MPKKTKDHKIVAPRPASSSTPAAHQGAPFSEDLDRIDRSILSLIQQDASLSASEIADRVGLTQAPCWRRIKRLEDDGYITQRVGLLNRKKLGLNVVIYAEVKLSAHGHKSLPEFEEKIRSFPEVTECYTMLGQIDFLLRVVTRDVETYEKFFREHLSQMPAVQEINSSVALSEIKYTTQIPLTLS